MKGRQAVAWLMRRESASVYDDNPGSQSSVSIDWMHSGTSLPGSFTSLLTGYTFISSVGNGTRSGWSRFGSFTARSSHRSYADLGTMTGIRSWIGARTPLASVVSKVQE